MGEGKKEEVIEKNKGNEKGAQNQNQCLINFSIDAGHIDISKIKPRGSVNDRLTCQ